MGEARDEDLQFPAPPEGLLTAPEDRVLAHMDDPEAVASALDELAGAGFDRDHVWVLCGPQGAERLDVTGRDHGLKGRVYRMVEWIGDERELLLDLQQHLASGGLALSVPADDEGAATAGRILREHGGHDVVHFGKGHWERLGPS